MKILCADDDHVTRRLLQYQLTKLGHIAVPAEDGEQALQIMESRDAPRLLILDWMMPKLGGLEVCKRLRQMSSRRDHYIMMLTSRGTLEDVREGFLAGVDDYLIKPVSTFNLQVRINTGLRMLDLQQDLRHMRESVVELALESAGPSPENGPLREPD